MVFIGEGKLTTEDLGDLLFRALGRNQMEILNDALNCYFRHPEEWGCSEEAIYVLRLLKIFDSFGVNSIKPQFDPFENSNLLREILHIRLDVDFQEGEE